jgi:crossover junction endodeoxyribonuclease RuvC
LQVKNGICGYGGADKKQVQKMVQMILNLKEIPKPDDAADALAIAVCHQASRKVNSL